MRKEKLFLIVVAGWWLLAGFGSASFAGSSTVSFTGGNARIQIITGAPGIVDQCEASGGELLVQQQLTTHSPTTIVRQAEFSGGGSITVVSYTSPSFSGGVSDVSHATVNFGVELKANSEGRLNQLISTGSPTQIQLAAEASGDGSLLMVANSKKNFDFNFALIFDYSEMSVLASADPFAISWITDFDDQMGISGFAVSW